MLWLIVLCAVIWFVWEHRAKPRNDLPGPKPLPIVGNLVEAIVNRARTNDFIAETNSRFSGKTWSVCSPGKRFIHIQSPTNMKYVFKDNFYNYVKGDIFYQVLHELLGDGIFVVDGENWRRQRKVASHLFKQHALKGLMVKVFEKHADTVIHLLENTPPNKPIDMQDIFFRYTLDCIGEIAFGVSFGCIEKETPPPFMKAFDRSQIFAADRVVYPDFYWKFLRLIGTPASRQFKADIQLLDDVAYKIARERKNSSDQDLKSREDLLSLFINDCRSRNETPTDKELRDVVMNFMIAGRDTTACTLSWTFYCLSQYLDIQKKVVDEINRVENNIATGLESPRKPIITQDDSKSEEIDGDSTGGIPFENSIFARIEKLKYLQAVIMEVLRLYPPVPVDLKVTVAADTLPDGTKVYPGELIQWSAWASGRSQELWENPLKFDPDRFYNKVEPSQYLYTVFNSGFRLCLGKQMAFLEAKLLASRILKKFELRLVPGHKVEPETTLTSPMRYGLQMTVHKRN